MHQQNFHESPGFDKPGHQNFATTKLYHLAEEQQLSPNAYPNPDLDSSFEDNLSKIHAQAIWKQSIEFLKKSLKGQFDQAKGFNDENIFQLRMEIRDSLSQEIQIFQSVLKNQLLEYDQKCKLISALKKSRHLKELLQKLSTCFTQQIFSQILFLFFQCWESYQLYKETTLLTSQLAKFLSPSYTQLPALDQPCPPSQSSSPKVYISESQSLLLQKSSQSASEIANTYFISTKLQYINLKNIDMPLNGSNIVRKEFEKFVQGVSKGVWLCGEGWFSGKNKEIQWEELQENGKGKGETGKQEDSQRNGKKRRNLQY